MRVADYIFDFVANLGVKQVFLLPGGGAMHLVDALGQNKDLEYIPCHHEQAAGIAAEAYARVTESIGVAVVTTGPGATNVLTAVAGAWIESVPLLIISGQVKRADMMRGRPLRQTGVQEVDIVSMIRSVTKYAVTIMEAADIRRELEKAYHLARAGRAGPVWIDVPLDIQGAPVDKEKLEPWTDEQAKLPGSAMKATERQFSELQAMLKQSERPLILAGHGIRLAGGARAFRALGEKLQIPVVTTWNAMDLLPYDHPLNVGKPGVVALRAPNFAIQNCDLLINIGSRLDNVITAYNPRGFARAAKKVVIDVDQNEIDKLNMSIQLSIAGDARVFLEAAIDAIEVENNRWDAWQRKCQDWKMRYSLKVETRRNQPAEISSYYLTDCLSDVIPEDMLVSTGSSGLAIEAFYTAFRTKPGQRVFLTSGLGAMGYGLPAAIGACFANNQQPMAAVESDGSLQLNLQELATLTAFKLPVCLVIMNNNGYASIRNTQRNYFNGRFVGTGPEAGLYLPDFAKLADTYEIDFMRIDSRDELREKLEQAISQTIEKRKPMIIDVHLVSDETLEPKVAALPQADGSMLSMPLEDMSPLLPLDVLKSEMMTPLLDTSIKARKED